MSVEVIGGQDITKAVTVYAKWDVNSYTVSYYDMGSDIFTGEFAKEPAVTYTFNTATSLINPTKTGYTFGGWYLSNGKKVTSLAKNTYTEDIDLYAKWTANSYAITYKDCNNAKFSGKLPTGYATKHTYDTETTLPVPTKTGYTFMGWYTDKACTEAIEVIGAKDITSAITVYAKWEANTYDIVYTSTFSMRTAYTLPENAPTTYTYNKKTLS